ncbi:MAG: adenosylcobinamide-GDP ribazoletransferase [Beijerinckiaceae bacterium]
MTPPPPVNPIIAIAQGMRFYSRLRVPRLPGEADAFAAPDGAAMARTLPVSAMLIAAPALLATWAATLLGLPAFVVATLAIIALVMTTGAFHEDGLADTADGFGGGATPARRLEIMKDSRVGTFGAAALCLGLVLRISALGTVLQNSGLPMALTLMLAAAIVSRVAGLVPLGALPSARSDGAGVAVGRPSMKTLVIAYTLAAFFAGALSHLGGWPLLMAGVMIVFSILIAGGMTWLSARMIGGQTGDVAGATQQIVEAFCYVLPLMRVLAW